MARTTRIWVANDSSSPVTLGASEAMRACPANCDCGEQSNVFECPVEQATATCDVGQVFLLREQFRWVDGVFTFDEFEWDRRDPARERRCTYTVELLPG